MTKCLNNDCQNEVPQGFKYCSSCYAKWRAATAPVERTDIKAAAAPVTKSWHSDPVVDALLKMNNNLARIAVILDEWQNEKETVPLKQSIIQRQRGATMKGQPLLDEDETE